MQVFAPAAQGFVKNWYCGTTRRSDILTEEERSIAIFTPPSHAIRKAKSVRGVLLCFRQEDISYNLVETKSVLMRIWLFRK